MMLVRMMDGNTITGADPFKLEDMYEVEKKSHRLTEQEIKDYDKRYWVFVEPVEELVELNNIENPDLIYAGDVLLLVVDVTYVPKDEAVECNMYAFAKNLEDGLE